MKGVEWVVLKDDGAGHKLLVSKHMHGWIAMNLTSSTYVTLDSGSNVIFIPSVSEVNANRAFFYANNTDVSGNP